LIKHPILFVRTWTIFSTSPLIKLKLDFNLYSDEHRNVGKNVFVHCQPWSSTSVSSKISIAYLIKYAGLSIADARTKVEGNSLKILKIVSIANCNEDFQSC
jgi:hypothetical protein